MIYLKVKKPRHMQPSFHIDVFLVIYVLVISNKYVYLRHWRPETTFFHMQVPH